MLKQYNVKLHNSLELNIPNNQSLQSAFAFCQSFLELNHLKSLLLQKKIESSID